MDIEYVDFDDLALSETDAAAVREQIGRSANRLHADGILRIHFAKQQHQSAKPNYSVHLFFEHEGHKHTTDKHHGWDLSRVLKDVFEALEVMIEKDRKLVGFNAKLNK